MKTRKFTVAAVLCSLLAACSGDPEGNNSVGTNNNAANNTATNNTAPNNTATNNVALNIATNNTSTNNAVTNNVATNNNVPVGPSGAGLAATADFATASSAWHRVALDTEIAADANNFGSGDLGVALGQSWAYVLDRNSAQVQVLDPGADLADLGVIDVSGVATTNPNDATDAEGKVYVSLYNSGELAVATPSAADWDVARLDLSAFDTYDNNPEPSAMASDGSHVLVVLQRLQDFVGVENSLLLVIDSRTDVFDAASALDLGTTNAQAGLRQVGANYAVGSTGDYGVNDGGIRLIERVGAGEYQLGEMLVDEAALGGDLLSFAFSSETDGFAVITLPDFSSQLVRFGTAGAEVVGAVVAPGFGGLDISPDGRWLAVGDRDAAGTRFVVFDLSDATFATEYEIAPSLPPAAFRFLP